MNFKNIYTVTNNNKIRYCFDLNNEDNIFIVNFIKKLEIDLLKNSIINNKRPIYKLKEQLAQGCIKIINILFMDSKNADKKEPNEQFILKISGIWESENEFGLTYKILEINKNLSISCEKL